MYQNKAYNISFASNIFSIIYVLIPGMQLACMVFHNYSEESLNANISGVKSVSHA